MLDHQVPAKCLQRIYKKLLKSTVYFCILSYFHTGELTHNIYIQQEGFNAVSDSERSLSDFTGFFLQKYF